MAEHDYNGPERREGMSDIRADIKYIIKGIDEIKDCVFGEGDRPGLKGRMAANEKDIEDMKSHRNKLYAFAASAGLLAIGDVIAGFFKHH